MNARPLIAGACVLPFFSWGCGGIAIIDETAGGGGAAANVTVSSSVAATIASVAASTAVSDAASSSRSASTGPTLGCVVDNAILTVSGCPTEDDTFEVSFDVTYQNTESVPLAYDFLSVEFAFGSTYLAFEVAPSTTGEVAPGGATVVHYVKVGAGTYEQSPCLSGGYVGTLLIRLENQQFCLAHSVYITTLE